MKKDKISYAVFFLTIIVILAVNGLFLFIRSQREYSENENRYLTTFQPFAITGFLDTSLQKNLTDGSDDQFFGRDIWMKFAASLQCAIGFRDMGGVYLGRNGCYFERILDSSISESRYLNNLQYLEKFSSSYHTKTAFLPVPSKGTILKDQLPANAVLYDADRLYSQAKNSLKQTKLLDIRPDLEEESHKRQIYFNTDHHWTIEAAYRAYAAWQHMRSADSTALEHFSPECVSRTFYGTLYSKAPAFGIRPDKLYIPAKLPKAKVRINAEESDAIYDMGKLDTKDKYGVYFGGNFAQIEILMDQTSNDKNKTNKKLLIIKDSFANSIVPFLMPEYSEIIMLDLRYFNESISELMKKYQPDETLVLYEISNFAQDMNFFKILK